jgi:uncharacterized protein YgbK (DUF1537 family)
MIKFIMTLNYQNTISSLPQIPNTILKPVIQKELEISNRIIIVLDDDPTGTQTVHNVSVLTVWDEQTLTSEIEKGSKIFFILTNSRSMTADLADALNQEIGENIKNVFEKNGKEFTIISRGDSTLRGHYPNELLALTHSLQVENYITAIIPAFFEGGRFTIDDVHYVREGQDLIPAAETPFAKDKAFGFTQSNLKNWVEEKTHGTIKSDSVISFSLKSLRENSIEEISEKIKVLPENSTIIVNATDYYDLEKFTLAYYHSGVKIVFRTAASFVKAIAGIDSKELLEKEDLVTKNNPNGGLIIVGSYVPKTTKQLSNLLKINELESIELNINAILNQDLKLENVLHQLESLISKGKNVVLFTSRNLLSGKDEKESLHIGNTIADFVTSVVENLSIAPKFIIAKGGITSSDIATKALKIKRAKVLGQALAGVPVWGAGIESKFPFMPYIIFPGNVGNDDSLVDLYEKLS